MKKITLLAFVCLSALSTISCYRYDKTNTSPVVTKDNIIGKWNLKLVDLKITVDGQVYSEQKDLDLSQQLTMQFDFKEDKKVHLYQYTPATDEEEAQELNVDGTYEKNGNDLTITIEQETQTFKILLNDTSNLHLFLKSTDTYEGMEVIQETTFKMVKM